ncbi:MAG: hypothetical protein ACO3I1_03995 [Burkholderiales bacterium]
MRNFIDPATGDVHPESFYESRGVSLDSLIEVVGEGEYSTIKIDIENFDKLDIKSGKVIHLLREVCLCMAKQADETTDPEEREIINIDLSYICKILSEKLGNKNLIH